jgi:hypothetical protein
MNSLISTVMDEQDQGVTLHGGFCKISLGILLFCWVGLGTMFVDAAEEKWSPLPGELTAENAGLFVGVNDYPKEAFLPLKFSVNDAVAQAEMFVLRLKLIPAGRCHLLLAGTPTDRYKPQMQALKDAGAVVVFAANRTSILYHVETVKRLAASSNSLLVVSFSGHGNEYLGVPYFIPSDGLAGIPSSFLSLSRDVADGLNAKGHQKRLLFIDACRLDFQPGQKGNYRLPEITAAFRKAFEATKGLVTLASCGAGQASLEDPRSESGVFTGKLIAALDGGIGGTDSEFITLGQVSSYLQRVVPQRATELAASDHRITEDQIQHVWHQGTLDALDVPLALSPHAEAVHKRLVDRKQEAKALLLESARSSSSELTPALIASVGAAIDAVSIARQGDVLDTIETKLPRSGKRDPKSFAAWWNDQRRQQVVGPAAAKGELEPVTSTPVAVERQGNGKPVFLVAPLAGIDRSIAEATQASFEQALKIPANADLKPLEDQVTVQTMDLATAERILKEQAANTLVLGSLGKANQTREHGTIGGRTYDDYIWEVPLTLTVFYLDQGKIMTHRKPFVGEAKRPVRGGTGDGVQDAIADAIDRLKRDAGRWVSKNN